MKICSLIPVRGGSKGIPVKPLFTINGKPMINYAIEASLMTDVIDETWVSTENNKIKNHVQSIPNVKILDRPSSLADDRASIEDVMMHFTDNVNYDILVLIQCTSPMTTAQDLNGAISQFKRNILLYDSAMSVCWMEQKDILFWKFEKNTVTPVNYNPKSRGIRQERTNRYFIETGAFYIIKRDQFLKSKCRVGDKVMPIEMPFWRSFEIDTFEDLYSIERLMK